MIHEDFLVSDTSVLINLERGALLESCFKLPFEFAVSDLLYAHELEAYGGPSLVARGLHVEELTGPEVATAQSVRHAHPKLSLPDAFAYALASSRQWTLLAGDGELGALAQAEQMPCFGVLWVLDQLFVGRAVEGPKILSGLEALAAHPRCGLPRTGIQERIERYWKSLK